MRVIQKPHLVANKTMLSLKKKEEKSFEDLFLL